MELGAPALEKAQAWAEVSRCVGWWWPHTEFIIACWRPTAIHIADGLLHNESGPAIVYPDGWGLYSWRGLRVPAEIISEPPTLKRIRDCTNAEHRRILVERYGTARYVAEAYTDVVDECEDETGQLMRLLRHPEPGDEPIVMIELRNTTIDPDGSRRTYHVRVPPETTTCFEARNWVCKLPPEARFDAQT